MNKKVSVSILAGILIIAISRVCGASSLLIQGGVNYVNGYTITDRSSAADTWNGSDGYTGSDYTGTYIGTITSDNNDSLADLAILIGYFEGKNPAIIKNYLKVDSPDTSNGALTVTYDSGNQSGTWSTASPAPGIDVDFYSIKGATEYALYYVDPSQQNGDWVTRHLLTPVNRSINGGNIPGISHISVGSSNLASAPEPASMLLFGAALVNLAGIVSLRRKKQ